MNHATALCAGAIEAAEAPLALATASEDNPLHGTAEEEKELNDEADALLAELASSQSDVLELMQRQSSKASELESLKGALVDEVNRRSGFRQT